MHTTISTAHMIVGTRAPPHSANTAEKGREINIPMFAVFANQAILESLQSYTSDTVDCIGAKMFQVIAWCVEGSNK